MGSIIGFHPKSHMFLREPSPMSVPNLIKLTRKLRDLWRFFCCHWTDPSETSSRRLIQMKRRCQFSSRFDILGGRWSLVIMVMGAESVGSRPWSQMTWRQNLVQIGRKLRVSRTKPFLQAWQEEAWPLVIGPSSLLKKKIKVVGFVSKSVGGRLWCKVTCMPNLVQIDREIKKFIRLCNQGRQCLRQGGPLGGQWGAPPHHHPLGRWAIAHGPKCNAWQIGLDRPRKIFLGIFLSPGPARQWVADGEFPGEGGFTDPLSQGPCWRKFQSCTIPLKIVGQSPMGLSNMRAKCGPRRSCIEKVSGTLYGLPGLGACQTTVLAGNQPTCPHVTRAAPSTVSGKKFSVFDRF